MTAISYKVTEAIKALEAANLKNDEFAKLVAVSVCKDSQVFKQIRELMEELKGKVNGDDSADALAAAMDWIQKRGSASPENLTLEVKEETPSKTLAEEAGEEEAEPEAILQFSTAVYYAKEGDDPEMVVDVMRLGNSDGPAKVKYKTEDGDGKAGSRYVAVSGELTFAPGDTMQQIHVPIIDSRAWSASLEFKIVLSEAEGGVLGRYLWLCRVKVIDPDCFPTNKYESFINAGDWGGIPLWGLLREYFKFNYVSVPLITRRSKHQLVTDQLSNLYFILQLYIGKLLVNDVVGDGCEPGKKLFLVIPCPDSTGGDQASEKLPLLIGLCLLMILPLPFVHYAEFCEVFFKLGGTSRKTIQGNLVRKFLNYDESARTQLAPSDLIMSVTRDTQFIVHDGFMQLYPLAQNVGKLFMVVIFQLLNGAFLAIVPVLLYPMVLIPWILCRDNLIAHLQHDQDDAQNDLVSFVTQIMTSYRLIGDFLKRPDAVEETEKRIGKFNGRMVASDSANLNNRYAALWLANIVTGLWYIVGGRMVITGGSDLGTFLMNLQVFSELGKAWTIIFGNLLKMQNALPYLQKIVRYMNLEADLEKRMKQNRRRRAMGEEARAKAREAMNKLKAEKGSLTSKFAADYVPIQIRDLKYSFQPLKSNSLQRMNTKQKLAAELSSGEEDKPTEADGGNLTNINMEIMQGTLTALVGKAGHGKSTLMRLIGAQLIPDGGDLLIPPHLRVLHISKQPIFFHDTLYNNLVYGVSISDKTDGDPNRVREVCKQLMVNEKIFKFLEPGSPDFNVKAEWGEVLNQTQSALLSLARAFITNPEILVIHKPTGVFDDQTTDNTFRCLRAFVEQKGLCLSRKSFKARRPRTCIITTARPKGIALADKVYRIEPDGCIEWDSATMGNDMLA